MNTTIYTSSFEAAYNLQKKKIVKGSIFRAAGVGKTDSGTQMA